MSSMNKTTSVMHFYKSEKDKEKDRLRETGGFENDIKSKTNYKDREGGGSNNRSSSTKEINNRFANTQTSDVKMPNIYTKENAQENKAAESSQKVYKSKFGIVPDVEKIKDELMKFKQEYNKKSKELHILKKDYFKLQDEHNQTLKVFETILNDPKTNPELFSFYNNEDKKEAQSPRENQEGNDLAGSTNNAEENKNQGNKPSLDQNLLSTNSFIKLREVNNLINSST